MERYPKNALEIGKVVKIQKHNRYLSMLKIPTSSADLIMNVDEVVGWACRYG